MKNQIPAGKAIVMIVLLAVVVAVAYFVLRPPAADWIPTPVIDDFAPNATIQWETRPVSQKELDLPAQERTGYQLAQQHCVRCHLFPDPNQLPRETWPFALTWMANYLGYENTYGPFRVNVDQSLIPDQPLVTEKEFRAIADYYHLASKTEAEIAKSIDLKLPLTQFAPVEPAPTLPPQTLLTMVHYDETKQQYYIGSASARALAIYDQSGTLLQGINLESEPVTIDVIPGTGIRLSVLGHFLTDEQQGAVLEFFADSNGNPVQMPVVEGYHRLTQSISQDFNQDGVEDLLLIGFGQGQVGKVSIFWRADDGSVTGEKELLNYAGALNAVTHDFDNDGLEDIMILTAQGRQELLLFRSQGAGEFEQQMIMKQFAGFGNNHFEIADFNDDGLMDLVIVNGNSMEIKDAPLKPYHGIRIYENQGDLTFEEKYFIRFDGALKSITEDFDQDGDLDIAAIAFYPDWSSAKPETFLYLENRGNYQFTPYNLPPNQWGRWISMSAADIDGDGFKDLLLGGGYIPLGVHTMHLNNYQQLIRNRPSLVVMKNQGGQ